MTSYVKYVIVRLAQSFGAVCEVIRRLMLSDVASKFMSWHSQCYRRIRIVPRVEPLWPIK